VAALAARLWRSFGHNGPRGPEGGAPVLVIPGFLAGDRTTLELRRALGRAGFRVHPWRQGWNMGARGDTLDRLRATLDALPGDAPVLLVGWSLGGLYARELARLAPRRVRAVVTLGSPISGDPRVSTNVWKLYERVAGHAVDAPPIPYSADKPPVPTLAIWSRRDGIVAGASARGADHCRDEVAEVDSTHMGFAVSRRAADRVAAEIRRFLSEAESGH